MCADTYVDHEYKFGNRHYMYVYYSDSSMLISDIADSVMTTDEATVNSVEKREND